MQFLNRILLFTLLVVTPHAFAQQGTGVLSGTVRLKGEGPAAGAAVTLVGSKLGASAKEDGTFEVLNVPEGTYAVAARMVGYDQTGSMTVSIVAGEKTTVSLELTQSAIEMRQVVVTGTRRLEANDTRSSVTTLSPRETKFLPGAAEDVLRSLQALPGVTSVSDFSSQLVVRGSGPDQNLIMIDGFEVLNPYRLYGFISMFNPETVSDISLQTGGFSAQYGDRLSAVLDVRTREGRSDASFGGKFNASLTNANLIAEGSVGPVSYLLSARRTYYDLILGPVLTSTKILKGDVALPNFRDLQAKIGVPIDASNKVLFHFFTSRDGIQLASGADRPRIDSVSIVDQSFNSMAGMTWQFNPRNDFILNTRFSWYRNTGAGLFDGSFVDPSQNTGDISRTDTAGIRLVRLGVNYDYVYQKTTFTQSALYTTGNHTVEAGYGADFLKTNFIRYFEIDPVLIEIIRARGQVVPTNIDDQVLYQRWNVFAQDKISFDNRFFVQPGLRYDFFPMLGREHYLAPRMNLSFRIDELTTLRGALGLYYQSPGMEKQNPQSRITFDQNTFHGVDAEQSVHYILGIDRMITPEWQFKCDTYWKTFADVIVPQKLSGTAWQTIRTGQNAFRPAGWTTPVLVTSDSLTSTPVNDATGNSYGVELMLQKIQSAPGDVFTGWISYALSYANRDRDGRVTPFQFDQRHAVNIVGNYRFAESWDVGVRFTLRTGRPFTRGLGVRPRISVAADGTPSLQLDARGNVILDVLYERDTFTGRLTTYHTLDLRLTTYPQWWGLAWSAYLDVQNVYNRQNEQQMNYYIDEAGSLVERPVNGLPIFPSLGLSVTF